MCLATEFTYTLTTIAIKINETNVTVQFWIMFLNCGTSLLVVIHTTAFKLQSVSIDLFFDLFIFRQEKTCSQM